MTKPRETMIAELGRRHPAAADDVDAILAMPRSDAVSEDMRRALERIERWFGEFPEIGRTWPDGSAMSYSAAFGSNGERDFMREVARAALALSRKAKP